MSLTRLQANLVLLKSARDIIGRINDLQQVEVPPKHRYQPLESSSYWLTEQAESCRNVVTAHRLNQYIRRVPRIVLPDDIVTWFDLLLENIIEKG